MQRTAKQNKNRKKKEMSLFPDFKKHYDTKQMRLNLHRIKDGDVCYLTEKLHGTSGRTGYLKKNIKKNIFRRLYEAITNKTSKEYDYISGTRNVTLKSTTKGFYKNNQFRNEITDRIRALGLFKGETLYYEIVGYAGDSRISPLHAIEDKKLKKKYGENMAYLYGCEYGKYDFYIYRVTFTNSDGYVFELPWDKVKERCDKLGLKHVPELCGPFFYDRSTTLQKCEEYSQGCSTLDSSHIKEGVCLRVGDVNFKYKSYHFCNLEGIMKNNEDYVDPEDVE